MRIFGIDIIRGSARSKNRRPVYALCQLEDGEIAEEGEVSTFRLLRKLHSAKADILAVDSLQEIAPEQHALCRFMQALPPQTRLVQVTGGERPESLGKVAARYNIRFNRFDPHAEARAIAQVAALGAGVEVVAFENTCEIVVSRHRSPGKGGWSQNRYIRRVHGAVRRKGREIEAALRSAGLKYRKVERQAFGGCSRVAFRVSAPREMVPVGASRRADIQVRIGSRRLDRIRFKPLSGKKRYIITGIDPGTTTGIAATDLDGNLVHLSSARQMAMSDIIEEIYRIGKPLIVAADVQQMPYSVEKVRRAFGAIPYAPRHDVSVEAKLEATSGYSYTNDHERDALSAALDACRHYKNKFQNIAKRVPPGYDVDEVRARVIRGRPLEQVLADLHGAPLPPEEEEAPEPEGAGKYDERVILLDGMVKRLRNYVDDLQTELKDYRQVAESLQDQIRRERRSSERRMRKDIEITKRDAIIRSLKLRLRKAERRNQRLSERLKEMHAVADIRESEGHTPIKVLESLTKDSVRKLTDDLGIEPDDVLYVRRIAGWSRGVVRGLAEREVGAVIVGADSMEPMDPLLKEVFLESGLPIISDAGLTPVIRGQTGMILNEGMESAIREWEEERRQFQLDTNRRKIEYLFREYQQEREREVKRGG